MKKILMAAVAALAITSCSQNEEFERQDSNNEISFNTGVSNVTRGAMVTSGSFKKFTAYAYINTGTFAGTTIADLISGEVYTKGADWVQGTSNKYYWPTAAENKVTFFGYGESTTATYAKAQGSFPTLTYTILDDVATQEDLVIAQELDKVKPANGSISLTFKHSLTQVYFKLKADDNALDYEVKKIAIVGAKNKGIFTFDGTATLGSWATASDATAKTYELIPTGDRGKVAKGASTVVALNDAAEAMVLLPQDLTGVKIQVTYIAKNGDVEVHSAAEPVEWALNGEWEIGKKIAYVLTLSGDKVTVTGSADDASWIEKTDEEIK